MNRDPLLCLAILTLSMAYAVVRYVVFQGVSVEQLPLYVTNKAISVTGLVLIGIAPLVGGERRRTLGTLGFLCVLLHVAMSAAILNPIYFAKFYGPDGFLHWNAELSLATGAVGAVMLYRLASQSANPDSRSESLIPGAGRMVLLLTATHVLLMGYQSWGEFAKWPGGMPPITLLSFLLAIVFLANRVRRNGHDPSQ